MQCTKNRLLLAALVFWIVGPTLAGGANAQDFTKKAVRIISTGPGGSSDTLARLLAEELRKVWANPVIVENKSGVGGIVSTVAVEKAAPDGHTLLINTSAFIVSAVTSRVPPYDPIGGFEPVALLGKGPMLLVARPNLAEDTLPKLLAAARQKPATLTYGSTGLGGITHLSAELLFEDAKVQLTHIPFKNGSQAVQGLAGDQIDTYLGSISASLPLLRAGRIKALAVTSLERSRFAPDIPTAVEGGLPNFSLELWWGIFAPAHTPQPIVDEINRQINKILAKPEFREHLAKEGLEATPVSSEQFGKFLRAEDARWKKAVNQSGFEKQ